MRKIYLWNGHPLPEGRPFTIGDTNYPAHWLKFASAEDLAHVGITVQEVQPTTRPDDRFYFVHEHIDGSYTALPKPLDSMKDLLLNEIRAAAHGLLSPTDWMIVRQFETGKPLDNFTAVYRAAVREACDRFEEMIKTANSVEELAALRFEWPSMA